MISKIKFFLFRLFLRFRSKPEIPRKPAPLSRAKSIGILFDASDAKNNALIQKYAGALKAQHINLEMLGYLPKREFGFVCPFPFITDKETGWYGKPGGQGTHHFIESRFDLLINFCVEECLPLEYICAVSPAGFRIGFNKNEENANYDLILIPKENKDISNLIQNLEHYLK